MGDWSGADPADNFPNQVLIADITDLISGYAVRVRPLNPQDLFNWIVGNDAFDHDAVVDMAKDHNVPLG